jgi:hypothetical protein
MDYSSHHFSSCWFFKELSATIFYRFICCHFLVVHQIPLGLELTIAGG